MDATPFISIAGAIIAFVLGVWKYHINLAGGLALTARAYRRMVSSISAKPPNHFLGLPLSSMNWS